MAFRKRRAQQRIERDPDSQKFRAIRDRINVKDFSGALAKINNRLAIVQAPLKRATLLALAGDCAFKRGAYAEAKQAYDAACALSANHARLWFRPLLASIRCDIKLGLTDAALQFARQAFAISEQKAAAFAAAAATANAQLQATGQATIPVVPLRIPVVATKLGDTFFLEGEPDSAKEFYEKALAANPSGSSKARIGLSCLALSHDQPEVAVQRATEALTLGLFRKKTIPAWKSLIGGLRKLGPVTISPQLLAGLNGAEPSVRARAVLELVTQLRSSGSEQWKDIANGWMTASASTFPSVAAELRKGLMADARLKGEPSANSASAFLATPLLTPQEWLSGAKVVASNAFESDAPFDFQSLIANGMSLFGPSYLCSFAHGLGLTAQACGKVEIARGLFNQAASAAGPDNQGGWSKAIWALAELNDETKDYPAASQLWQQVATNYTVPEKFRLQAMVKWAVALQLGNPAGSLNAPKAAFLAAASSITKADVILDMGRQLRCSPVQWPELQDQLVAKGEQLALAELNGAAHPSLATVILHKLARRQYYEFFRFSQIVATWNSLSAQKRLWLWSDNALLWEYISFVYGSLNITKNEQTAEALAKFYIEDPATPPVGLVILGAAYYLHLITTGRMQEALDGFNWIKDEAPSRPEAGVAFYWLALSKAKVGEWSNAKNLAGRARLALKAKFGTSVEKETDMKALIILSDFDVSLAAETGFYKIEELSRVNNYLQSDIRYV